MAPEVVRHLWVLRVEALQLLEVHLLLKLLLLLEVHLVLLLKEQLLLLLKVELLLLLHVHGRALLLSLRQILLVGKPHGQRRRSRSFSRRHRDLGRMVWLARLGSGRGRRSSRGHWRQLGGLANGRVVRRVESSGKEMRNGLAEAFHVGGRGSLGHGMGEARKPSREAGVGWGRRSALVRHGCCGCLC